MEKERHLGIRTDESTLYKLRFISKYYGRSMTQHLLFLARQDIAKYEKEHGVIEVPEQK